MDEGYSWIKDREAKNIIYYIILISYTIILLIKELEIMGKDIGYMHIPFILIAFFVIRHYFLNIKKRAAVLSAYVLVVIELCLIYTVYSTEDAKIQFLFIIFTTDIIICFNQWFSSIFSLLGFSVYFLINSILVGKTFEFKLFNDYLLQLVGFSLIPFTMIIAKRQFIQSNTLKALMEELKGKTLELEELAVLKERNRIAGEMHDTVGHTLTTALVEIEASKLLFDNNPHESYIKLNLAGEQMRKGLKELRDSVKKVSEGESLMAFIPSLHTLKIEMEKHADIKLHLDIDDVEGLLPVQQKVLYRVIMESVTNSIRHGKASEVFISLKEAGDVVNLSLRDNGSGQDDVVLGFGLSVMQDRVKGLGGRMVIESKKGKGFLVAVEIPKGE